MMNSKRRLISVLQVVAALGMFFCFFCLAPWGACEPIENLERYPEMSQKYPPPPRAKYFIVGHGVPSYFETALTERPLLLLAMLGAFLVCFGFLIVSALWYSNIDGNKTQVIKPLKIPKALRTGSET